jgi:hypothetical protein
VAVLLLAGAIALVLKPRRAAAQAAEGPRGPDPCATIADRAAAAPRGAIPPPSPP